MQEPYMTKTPSGVEYVTAHLSAPRDGCPYPCCRITFTDHTGAVRVWSWERGQWSKRGEVR